VSDVATAESGVSVMVEVPGATAPWHCLSDAKGQVQSMEFTGRDGDYGDPLVEGSMPLNMARLSWPAREAQSPRLSLADPRLQCRSDLLP